MSLIGSALGWGSGRPGAATSRTATTAASGILQAGRRLAVKIVGDNTLWHERIVLSHLAAAEYLLLSPDLEIVQEDLAVANGFILAVRLARPDGTIQGVDPSHFYGFEGEAELFLETDLDHMIAERRSWPPWPEGPWLRQQTVLLQMRRLLLPEAVA